MSTRLTLDIRRAFLALSAVVLLLLVVLAGISALLIWDSITRLEPLHEQVEVLADTQDKLLNLLVVEQRLLDLRTGTGDQAADTGVEHRDDLLRTLDVVAQQVSATLGDLGTAQKDYASLTRLTTLGVVLLVMALVALVVVGRERVLKPLGKLANLLGRLAREDYRPEPLDGVDAFIRPAFESYNRLVGRLTRLEKAHRTRHERMETHVREAARVLVAQRAELARIERLAAVGEVAGALAHEVRNPLAAIRAACRSLIEDTGEEDTRERLRMIEDELESLSEIVDGQLRRTRHRPEAPVGTDITRLVRNLVRLMRYQMPGSVTLRMELPRRLVSHLPPNGLRQALLNLIRNSQEALEGGSGLIAIKAQEGAEGIEIRVEDSGSGFPKEMLASGVHRFVTGKKGGTGLGLAMVERYVRDQGGRLEIENRAEGGTRVRIVLLRGAKTEVRAA